MKFLIYIYISLLCLNVALAQNSKSDTAYMAQLDKSIQTVLYNYPDSAIFLSRKLIKTAQNSQNEHWASIGINQLGNSFYIHGQIDSADLYYLKNLAFQNKNKDTLGLAKTYNNLGNILKERNDYIGALEYYEKSLYYRKMLKDETALFGIYANIGILFDEQGDYPTALDYYFKALRIAEKYNQNDKIATAYNNIAIIYKLQNKLDKSLEYNFKSLKIRLQGNNKHHTGTSYNNIANIYEIQGKLNEALNFYEKAKKLAQETDDKFVISMLYNNIGGVYTIQKKYKLANEFLFKSLEQKTEIDDKYGMAEAMNNIGDLYYLQNDFKNSSYWCYKSYLLGKEIKIIPIQQDGCDCLYKSFKGLKDYEQATKYLELYLQFKDSIFNDEKKNLMLEKEFEYKFDKKSYEDSLLNQAQKQILQSKIEKEKSQKISLYIGLAIVLVFSGFVINRWSVTQKQKKVIEIQKQTVELKNTEITQSILYAQKIQTALFPSESDLKKFFPESFAILKPKDIVSGDFYWISDRKDYVFYATADCTGHGVPGGFMSMLGMAILNEIVDEMHISDCGQILNLMREKIINGLNQFENTDTKDGMDLVLLRIDRNTSELQYASANNPFYVVRNGILTEYKASKMPVGIYNAQMQPFTSTTIPIQQNDTIYTFSDGFADQFGGDKSKKLGYKNFRDKLTELSKLNPEDQKSELEHFFAIWKGNQEQIDDVCIISVRI